MKPTIARRTVLAASLAVAATTLALPRSALAQALKGGRLRVACTRAQRRSAFPWKRARVRFLRIAPGCWNFRLGLEDEQRCWCAGDTRRQ